MSEESWIAKIAPLAVKACKEMGGYLPSILIAQTCLENGYGMDSSCDILVEHNNILGMKTVLLPYESDWWDGESFEKVTPEWVNGELTHKPDSFRAYKDFYHCLMDYLTFMQQAKYSNGTYKYRDCLSYTDPYTLISTVGGRGYATDPSYATSVMQIVTKHNLSQYDKEDTAMHYDTVRAALKALGIDLIDRIANNASQVPKHNANTHEYFAVHYLGVNGENPDLYGGGYGGHFYVSKKGEVYQAALPTDKLWHVGASSGFSYIHPTARNANTVGVECATYTASGKNNDSEVWYFTEATQIAAAKLAASFMHVYGLEMSHLLRHGDITTKNCPSPYKRDEGQGSNWTWVQFKATVEEYMTILAGCVSDQGEGDEEETASKTIYRVQVGAYSVHANALKMLEKVKAAGFDAFINDYGEGVNCRYRVQIGAYEVRKNAYTRRKEAIAAGFSAIVKKETL